MNLPIKVIVRQAEEGGFWAEVPGMPGCLTEAETLDELRTNVRDALEGWLGATQDQAISTALAEEPGEVVTL